MIRRFLKALQTYWLRLLLGLATGVYVGFALCLALMIVLAGHNQGWDPVTLAFVMDAALMTSMVGGALIAWTRRPDAR